MYAVALVLQEYNKSADPKMGLCHSKSTDLAWEDYRAIFKEKTPHW
jgi:hypothetical protein